MKKGLTAPELWAARPGSDEDDSCAVGSSFSRAFQRRRMCRDRSPIAGEPRIMAPELWLPRHMGLILARLSRASGDLSNGCRGVVIGLAINNNRLNCDIIEKLVQIVS